MVLVWVVGVLGDKFIDWLFVLSFVIVDWLKWVFRFMWSCCCYYIGIRDVSIVLFFL